MKICVLVKEVPDAAVEKRINPQSGRMDRGGERNLNPYDTHAIEAAMQVKEGGVVQVDEIVAVTMGPSTAVRALHKAVSLGADRSVHLSDDALAGSDVAATGYALAKVLERESPDLVLLGQQSDDGECYTIGAVVADHLKMPSLTQVIKMDVSQGSLRCERQAEYGYDTVDIELPAVISVGDAINEPRYPSLHLLEVGDQLVLAVRAGIELIHQPPGGSDERGQAVGAVDGLRLGIELRLLQVDAAFLQIGQDVEHAVPGPVVLLPCLAPVFRQVRVERRRRCAGQAGQFGDAVPGDQGQ